MRELKKKVKSVNQPKIKIIFLSLYIIIISVFYHFDVECFFQRLLNIPCPGCGMTRAWISLLHFDLHEAFLNHFMFWSIPLLLLYFWFDGHAFKNQKINKALFAIIVVGFVMNWIVKLYRL